MIRNGGGEHADADVCYFFFSMLLCFRLDGSMDWILPGDGVRLPAKHLLQYILRKRRVSGR